MSSDSYEGKENDSTKNPAVDENPDPQASEQISTRKNRQSSRFWKSCAVFINTFSTLVIAIFTVVLVWVTGGQLGQMREQLKEMRAQSQLIEKSMNASIEASRLDQRAWIGLGESKIIQFEPDKSFKVGFETINSGKTPALHMADDIQLYIYKSPLLKAPLPEWIKILNLTPTTAVAPQGKFTIYGESGKKITPEMYNGVKDGSLFIYAFGEITYKTISGGDGSATFCRYMHPQTNTMAYCAEFNDIK